MERRGELREGKSRVGVMVGARVEGNGGKESERLGWRERE